MVHSFTAPQVSDTVTMCSVNTDANIVPSVPRRPLPTRSRAASMRGRPAISPCARSTLPIASPCQNSSYAHIVRKRGDHRIVVGAGHEQVTQVAHGVVLDVVHVPQAPQRIVGQRIATEVVVVDVGIVEGGDGCDVAVDVEVHVRVFVGRDVPVWSDDRSILFRSRFASDAPTAAIIGVRDRALPRCLARDDRRRAARSR